MATSHQAPLVCWFVSGGSEGPASALKDAVEAERLVVASAHDGPSDTSGVARGWRLSDGATIAHLANTAHDRWPDRDLVLVVGAVQLSPGWLGEIAAVVTQDATVATASALSVREPGSPDLPEDADPRAWLAELQGPDVTGAEPAASLPAPRLPASTAACILISASALALMGPLDEHMRTSTAAILDFTLRARQSGLTNVLASSVLLRPDPAEQPVSRPDEALLAQRFPDLMPAADEPTSPAVERAITAVRVSREPLWVTVDARTLGPHVGGTQEYVLALISSLALRDDLRVRAVTPPDLSNHAANALAQMRSVELLSYDEALASDVAPSHLVHRPQQVFSDSDLALLRPLGDRLVVTHQDLIAYHNPTYFRDLEAWRAYVRITRAALGAADHTIFFSRDALRDAAREDLVEADRASVVGLGAARDQSGEPETSPEGASEWGDEPFILLLGADYRHKNRPFALKLLAHLRDDHGWEGRLVMAGAHVRFGSSRTLEHEILSLDPGLAEHVVTLGAVTDAQRLWLMRRTAAVAYPSVQEGFGLLPFEAAAHGVPCLFADQSSLAELLPPELATLTSWNAAEAAARCAPLLAPGPPKSAHVAALQATAAAHPWSATAARTVAVYRAALTSTRRVSAAASWLAVEREAQIVQLSQAYAQVSDDLARVDAAYREVSAQLAGLDASFTTFQSHFSADARLLVGERGILAARDERALLSVAARGSLRRPLFGFLRAAYRLSHFAGRRGPRRG